MEGGVGKRERREGLARGKGGREEQDGGREGRRKEGVNGMLDGFRICKQWRLLL